MGSIGSIYWAICSGKDVDGTHKQQLNVLNVQNGNVNNSVAHFPVAHIDRAKLLEFELTLHPMKPRYQPHSVRARHKNTHICAEFFLCWHQVEEIRLPNAPTKCNQGSVFGYGCNAVIQWTANSQPMGLDGAATQWRLWFLSPTHWIIRSSPSSPKFPSNVGSMGRHIWCTSTQ